MSLVRALMVRGSSDGEGPGSSMATRFSSAIRLSFRFSRNMQVSFRSSRSEWFGDRDYGPSLAQGERASIAAGGERRGECPSPPGTSGKRAPRRRALADRFEGGRPGGRGLGSTQENGHMHVLAVGRVQGLCPFVI